MNCYQKGKRIEAKAKKELEKEGYLVEQAKMTRFGQKDLFGLFDLIAIPQKTQKDVAYGNVRLIQIKSNRITKQTKEKLSKFSDILSNEVIVEYWVHKDRKGFDKYIVCADGIYDKYETSVKK